MGSVGAIILLGLALSCGCAVVEPADLSDKDARPIDTLGAEAGITDMLLHDMGANDMGTNDMGANDVGPMDRPDLTPLPRAPGPDPDLFDCNADFDNSLRRRSPAPINCILDTDCEIPMVVGHRGVGGQFAGIAPENSLAAIRAALLMGVDGVELDVRHTVDERLVLMHDSTVDRTTTGTGLIDEMTLDEATALQVINSPFYLEVPGNFECERVPTLEEAFALTRGRMFIDLDTKSGRMDLVVNAIVAADMVDEVFISVGDVERAVAARQLNPDIRIQVRPDTPEELMQYAALFDRAPDVIEIPPGQIDVMSPMIRFLGSKVFADVFADDAHALLAGDQSGYAIRYGAGAHILQSEAPSLVLESLGRLF
jgi:glycerophosphoryl diester phosphodiesterase